MKRLLAATTAAFALAFTSFAQAMRNKLLTEVALASLP